MSIVIRANSGLGDSIYLQSVARYFVNKGHEVAVCSSWPDVFRYLPVKVHEFRRNDVTHVAAYTMRKGDKRTTQFMDCCIQAGIRDPVEFRLDWKTVNTKLVREIYDGRPIVLVQLPRTPMDRKDGFGDELLPDCNVIQRAIDLLKPHAKIVQAGKGDARFQFSGIDLDLSNRTSVSDLIDVAHASDALLGYCSYMVPLAESLGKPALFVWSRRGLKSTREFIARITPQKILHCATSKHVIDDCSDDEIAKAVDELCAEIGCTQTAPQADSGDCRLRARSA